MGLSERPVVVGGGAAGIIACLTLEKAGYSPLLLEADDRLGGRLRTETMSDGTRVDVGFQILLTAYPELQKWADIGALDPVRFVPGAKVHHRGRWKTVADPLRAPSLLLQTLTSNLGTFGDQMRILALLRDVRRGTALSIQNQQSRGTTLSFLKTRGFSDNFISRFLAPFFSGIFLNRALDPPSAQFCYTFRMLATGDVVRPRMGMASLVNQLERKLQRTEVRTGTPVQSISENHLVLGDGSTLEASGAIVTIPGLTPEAEPPLWNSCLNVVFACSQAPFGRPIIGLIPDSKAVTNFHFMEDVQGEEGKGKVNATAVIARGSNPDTTLQAMRDDLLGAGIRVNEILWQRQISRALPQLAQVRSNVANPRNPQGGYIAGDHTAAPSLDAAMRSGRVAAEAWIEDHPKKETE